MKKFVKRILKERIHKLLIKNNHTIIKDKNNEPFKGIFETILPLSNNKTKAKQETKQSFKIRYYLQHSMNIPIYLIDQLMTYLAHHNFLHLDLAIIGLIIEELQQNQFNMAPKLHYAR
jgi:hypothetical protein